MSATTRLQQHTEVLSHILSFTDRQSLIPCLRVSTQLHAIASLHIGKVYNHVTIDRDSIKSVFAGIRWDEMEESWVEEIQRWRKGRGRMGVKNEAKHDFSYVALFEGVAWEEMDEGWRSPAQAYFYGSTKDDRHAWKVYALSKCTVVTLCDTWATIDRDSRFHTHNILHNGKAHQLFPQVETVRVIPLTSAHSIITPLCSAEEHCPFIQEIAPKKLVHRNITLAGVELTSEPVDELVLFLPNARWPSDDDYYTRTIAYLDDRLAAARCTIIKLVFGPPLADKNRSDRHIQYSAMFRPEDRIGHYISLLRLLNIIRSACAQSTMTHIYGLEQVRVPRDEDDYFDDFGGTPRMESYTELLDLVKGSMLGGVGENPEIPPGPHHNFRIHTLREYVTSYPDDELLDHELSGTECWEWQSTDYWSRLFSPGGRRGKGRAGQKHDNGFSGTMGSGSRRRYG